MHKVKCEVQENVPLFKCSFCGKCSGFLEATSYLTVKSRGCCWYFPKYKLIDIKNIIDLGKSDFIYEISNMPNSKIEKYSIEVLGYFDEEKYKKLKINHNDFDTKLFFRLCPFFKKSGCSIDFTLRPHPCNLYLCREVIEACGEGYEKYSRERKDYFAYCNYYNDLIQRELAKRNIDFVRGLDEVINLLKKINIPKFDFRRLDEIIFEFEEDIAI